MIWSDKAHPQPHPPHREDPNDRDPNGYPDEVQQQVVEVRTPTRQCLQ
jgi:hypothetical protein